MVSARMVTSRLQRLGLASLCCLFLISVVVRTRDPEAGTTTSEAQAQASQGRGEQEQRARRAAVIRSCVARAGHAVLQPMNPYFPSKFFPASLTLAEEEGIGWCRIGKVRTGKIFDTPHEIFSRSAPRPGQLSSSSCETFRWIRSR